MPIALVTNCPLSRYFFISEAARQQGDTTGNGV